MTFLLRFVQKFRESEQSAFLALERKFIQLEAKAPEFPKGRRYTPFSGRELSNTLIWECEFPSLEAVQQALDLLERDSRHAELFEQQVPFFIESYVEIYRGLED